MKFDNLIQLCEAFKTEKDCVDYLIETRYENGKVTCPYKECECNVWDTEHKVYAFKNGTTFKCASCKKRFSARVGTIFEDSNIPLKKWFVAIYLLTSHKKGISSLQLAKDIKVTQKTSWFMLQRLRHASKSLFTQEKFKGVSEADELYIGGSESNKHANKKGLSEKIPVLGIVNRDTKQVISHKVSSTNYITLGEAIMKQVEPDSNLITDGFSAYETLGRFYKHNTVNHSSGEYVKEVIVNKKKFKAHTNTIEGFFGMVRRVIDGTYHYISSKHINKYLDEISYRYNTRDLQENQRFDCFLQNLPYKMSYKVLVA
jgi:transposase-like protein